MSTLGFLTAVYNEENEIIDLLMSVRPYVDDIVVSDDGSTDSTRQLAIIYADVLVSSNPTHSCEETRIRGLQRSISDWILLLDADERIPEEDLQQIRTAIPTLEADNKTHVYFTQYESIDGIQTRSFEKIKLFKRKLAHLPELIHGDIYVEGDPANMGWMVMHRKTSEKQRMREKEYLQAYKEKVAEGKMTQEWADKVTSWHYYERGQE